MRLKILVMGGNRFFGKRLVGELLHAGHDVTLLNRGLKGDDFGDKVTHIVADRKSLNLSTFEKFQAPWDLIYDHVCYDALEARNACEVFKGKVKNYIFISSQSVYDPGENISESVFDPARYRFEKIVNRDQDYNEAKRQAEAVFFQEAQFAVTAARISIVVGEDDYTDRLKFHLQHIKNKTPFYLPNLDAKISLSKSQDVGLFLAKFTRQNLRGPVNFSSTDPISLKDFIDILETKTQSKVVLGSKNSEPSPYGIEKDWWMNTHRLKTFGFNPEPIAEWLPRVVENIWKRLER